MQENNRIIELFEKLLHDRATDREKKELFYLMNIEKNKTIVFGWLKKHWEEVEFDHLSIASKSLLDKIHYQAGIDNVSGQSKAQKAPKIRKIIRVTLRYAAVVIIALGIQWFILSNNYSSEGAFVAQATQYNEITVPAGSKSFVVLADSTKVWLNAGAKFRYPSDFQKNSRDVYLEGEAFFDVSKNEEMPFFVNMKGMNIKVLGTQFNVKAYADEESIEATLLEGSIEVLGLKSDKKDEDNLKLVPGQKLILIKDQNVHKVTTNKVQDEEEKAEQVVASERIKIKQAEVLTLNDLEPEISWKEDKLIFYKERFENVKIKLERWYGVTIDVKDQEILDYRFTGTFDKETFEQAMFALKQAARFDYIVKKKQVIIKRI